MYGKKNPLKTSLLTTDKVKVMMALNEETDLLSVTASCPVTRGLIELPVLEYRGEIVGHDFGCSHFRNRPYDTTSFLEVHCISPVSSLPTLKLYHDARSIVVMMRETPHYRFGRSETSSVRFIEFMVGRSRWRATLTSRNTSEVIVTTEWHLDIVDRDGSIDHKSVVKEFSAIWLAHHQYLLPKYIVPVASLGGYAGRFSGHQADLLRNWGLNLASEVMEHIATNGISNLYKRSPSTVHALLLSTCMGGHPRTEAVLKLRAHFHSDEKWSKALDDFMNDTAPWYIQEAIKNSIVIMQDYIFASITDPLVQCAINYELLEQGCSYTCNPLAPYVDITQVSQPMCTSAMFAGISGSGYYHVQDHDDDYNANDLFGNFDARCLRVGLSSFAHLNAEACEIVVYLHSFLFISDVISIIFEYMCGGQYKYCRELVRVWLGLEPSPH